MRILVLGAYGLIGSHATSRLLAAGHHVVGLGRDTTRASVRIPDVQWIAADLSRLTDEASWGPSLDDASPDAIVNCAGILQDGLADDVARVQSAAMQALFQACASRRIQTFVQVSAPRANPDADTAFMRTKGEADAALRRSTLDWTILRPGLVLSPEAYGGSSLLRALAACPVIQPLAHPNAKIQTVSVEDVSEAVCKVIAGEVATRQVYDLVETTPHDLRDIVGKMRTWLGFPQARILPMPAIVAKLAAAAADALGWLGWRSPMRSTAFAEVAAGVTGDASAWIVQTGRPLRTLDETLRTMPATVQERWFARAFLLKPLVIGILSLFWCATGLIALLNQQPAIEILTQRGITDQVASAIVLGGAIADLALGLAILVKRTARGAAIGMIALTAGYLIGGTIIAPDLWLDPLGALVKPIPAMVLALVAIAMLEDR
jgi:uncharacterized protein YbjT (DUF2867 family)